MREVLMGGNQLVTVSVACPIAGTADKARITARYEKTTETKRELLRMNAPPLARFRIDLSGHRMSQLRQSRLPPQISACVAAMPHI